MSDTASIGRAQREFWNGDATRRWVTEQAHIDQFFAKVTDAALAAAAPTRGEGVLDIGCGTGTTVLRLAEAVGPSGRVLGIDISEPQFALARQRIAAAGVTQVQLVLDDAATHELPPACFDLCFSRFGVMFFAEPITAFRNIRRAMKPSGRLVARRLPVGTRESVGDRERGGNRSPCAAARATGTGGTGAIQLERSGAGEAYPRRRRLQQCGADTARPGIYDRARRGWSGRIRDVHRAGRTDAARAVGRDAASSAQGSRSILPTT